MGLQFPFQRCDVSMSVARRQPVGESTKEIIPDTHENSWQDEDEEREESTQHGVCGRACVLHRETLNIAMFCLARQGSWLAGHD